MQAESSAGRGLVSRPIGGRWPVYFGTVCSPVGLGKGGRPKSAGLLRHVGGSPRLKPIETPLQFRYLCGQVGRSSLTNLVEQTDPFRGVVGDDAAPNRHDFLVAYTR